MPDLRLLVDLVLLYSYSMMDYGPPQSNVVMAEEIKLRPWQEQVKDYITKRTRQPPRERKPREVLWVDVKSGTGSSLLCYHLEKTDTARWVSQWIHMPQRKWDKYVHEYASPARAFVFEATGPLSRGAWNRMLTWIEHIKSSASLVRISWDPDEFVEADACVVVLTEGPLPPRLRHRFSLLATKVENGALVPHPLYT